MLVTLLFVRPFIALVNTEALKKSSLVSKSSLSQVIFILLFLSQQCPSFFYLNFRNRLLTIITSNLTHTCPKNNKHTKTSTKKYLHCKSCKINNLLASERLPCRSCGVLKALDEGSQDSSYSLTRFINQQNKDDPYPFLDRDHLKDADGGKVEN